MKHTQPLLILAPSIQRQAIYEQLLQNRDGYLQVDVLSLHVWLTRQTHDAISPAKQFCACYKRVNALRNQLTILRESAKYPFFTEEIIRFYKRMLSFPISISDLPEETALQKELKQLLSALVDVPFLEKEQSRYLNELPDASYIRLSPLYYHDILLQKQYNLLLDKNAQWLQEPRTELQTVKYYVAQNQRQEVEALAQYLIANNRPLSSYRIVLGDPDSYLPLCTRIFQRYQIPYHTSLVKQRSLILHQYELLFSYLLAPDMTRLVDCLQAGCFSTITSHLLTYLNLFQPDSIETLFSPLIIHEAQSTDDQALIAQAEIERSAIAIQLHKLSECPETLINAAVEAYRTLDGSLLAKKEKTAWSSLKSLLEEVLYEVTDATELLWLIQKINLPLTNKQNGVALLSLEQSIGGNYEETIILGAKALPQFQFHSGIFDEDYYALLNYPSKEERYQLAIQETNRMLEQSKSLVLSEAIADYAGKARKLPAYWDSFFAKHPAKREHWPITEYNGATILTHTLSTQHSFRLFLKENVLHGSVSSFEQYFHCPYAYFVRYGLKLREQSYGISAATLGSLLHAINETLVNRYQKAYAAQTQSTYEALIEEQFATIQSAYPHCAKEIAVIKERFTRNFFASLTWLKDMEENTMYDDIKSETRFEQSIETTTVMIHLRGIIDRIDQRAESYRILDYKSSNHSLKEDEIRSGVSLQLLTYLILIQKEQNRIPDGCYYFSFANPNIAVSAGKYTMRTRMTERYDRTDYKQEWQKAHALNGWSFVPLEEEATLSLSNTKCYDYATYQEVLQQLYNVLAERLLAGIISPAPIKGSCEYCAYQGICQYYGEQKDTKEAVIVGKEEQA